jgi:hypothetical protein
MLGFQKCLKWGQSVPLSPMPGNFGQIGHPRQFGLPAGQFCFIKSAICTEENRFQVGIPKMLKMETEGHTVPDARQFWAIRAVVPGNLARKPCPTALDGSLARQPCPAALLGSLARRLSLKILQV